MNLKKFLEARRKAINPAKFNLRNAYAVFQAWFRKKRRILGGFDLDDHMYEQIIWRRVQVYILSPKCYKEGACKLCGCDIEGKTMEDRGCEGFCYPEMMNQEQWKEYKTINNIKFFD